MEVYLFGGVCFLFGILVTVGLILCDKPEHHQSNKNFIEKIEKFKF